MITNVDNLGLETFTIQEVCKATGLSRAFLIKLEKTGILKPYKIDERTGYRKYTLFEISNILQYRLLREMDISQEEIADYFGDRDRLKSIIERMRVRQNLMQRAIEELELRLCNEEKYSFSFIDLPDVRCYCGTEKFVTPADIEVYTARLVEEAVRLGFTRLSYEPLFSIRWDTDTKMQGNPDSPYEATICVPILLEFAMENIPRENHIGHIETIHGGRAFSMLYHGGYEEPGYFNDVFSRLWKEIKDRQLTTTGPVRCIGIVAPYVGLDIAPKDYVFRFAVPVENSPK
ncbi:MAG: MerR family transcriptional regulator [Lachnospiraceae bacterium]|nr:MerR family transcriptional regulator [Lachnospiraceae bacterium]